VSQIAGPQGSKSAIYSTDVYGSTAYHAVCLEPGCDWESKRYDRIKQAQDAAMKHAESHFKVSGKRSEAAATEHRGAFSYKGREYWANGKMRYNPRTGRKEYQMESGKGQPTIWVDTDGNVSDDKGAPRRSASAAVEERADDGSRYRSPGNRGMTYTASEDDYEPRGLLDVITYKGHRYRQTGRDRPMPESSGARGGRVWQFVRLNDDGSDHTPIEFIWLDWYGNQFDPFKYPMKSNRR
jgi:hypothetical protein